MELSHVPGFYYYYFWRVEVKLNYCSLEVFPEPGLFWVFTLSGPLAWLFSFLSSIALKLTSFPDFISILSAVAWNYPTCQAFFYYYFWRVKVKLNYCSLEVYHERGLFCGFTLSGSLAFLFLSYIALKLTRFLDFIIIFFTVPWNYLTCQAFFFLTIS